jgi:hypothetical protein
VGVTTELRREIKQRVFPLLEAKGFACDQRAAPRSVTFRRTTADAIHLLDIQWEKYGKRRFVVNFGRCGRAGVVVRGERVPAADVFPSFAPVNGRLQPGKGGTAAWFRQDRSLVARLLGRPLRPASEVVSQLLELLPEVEAFWERGEVGPHLTVYPAFPGITDAAP